MMFRRFISTRPEHPVFDEKRVRNEISKAKHSKPFEYLTYEQQKEIRAKTPLIVGEAYNSNEKFLYDFFKKEKNKSTSN